MNVLALKFWCIAVMASLCSHGASAQRRRRRVSAELHEVQTEDLTFWRALTMEESMSLSSMSMVAPQAPPTAFPTKSPVSVEVPTTPEPSSSEFPSAAVTEDPTVSAFPSIAPTDEPTFTAEPSGTSEPSSISNDS